MKRIMLLLTVLLFGHSSFGQSYHERKVVTPQILQQLKADIEKEVPAFEQKLPKLDVTSDRIEFSLDTFRIERLVSKRIDLDYSTVGMNEAVEEKTASYDKLMNKYYNKLLKTLEPEDRKVLINAQKAWLAYRDAEAKLTMTITKDEYSGGGSMQSNFRVALYSSRVVERTIDIFNYYDSIIKKK